MITTGEGLLAVQGDAVGLGGLQDGLIPVPITTDLQIAGKAGAWCDQVVDEGGAQAIRGVVVPFGRLEGVAAATLVPKCCRSDVVSASRGSSPGEACIQTFAVVVV